MKISELKKFGKLLNFSEDKEITGISYDSRKVKRGDLFVALVGRNFDGHNFVDEALKRGAFAAIVSKRLQIPIPQLLVNDTREIMAHISAYFFQYPSKYLKVTGITGTNGKSTTTFIIHNALKLLHKKSSLLGTIGYEIIDKFIKAERTTPEAPDIQRFMFETWKNGGEFFNMEVSSQSVCEKRIKDIEFNSAIFTNLSREHLEYHKTFENYKKAKINFFQEASRLGAMAFVNIDDPYHRVFIDAFLEFGGEKLFTYGVNKNADFTAVNIELSIQGSTFFIKHKGDKYHIFSKLIGMHNVYNLLAAFCVLINYGLDPFLVSDAISKISQIPGRLERIVRNDVNFFIDYAHTPEALKIVLNHLKRLSNNRLILVFGAGGDRDARKRPLMGSIASELADFIILTSDNPRNEDPLKIVKDIEAGITSNNYTIEIDREKAIRMAYSIANAGDIILVAGKGHEEYQEIKGKKYHFSDKEVILAL